MPGVYGSFDDVASSALSTFAPIKQGRSIFVRPANGNDGNSGLSARRAVKTLVQALKLATANQNDVVYMMGESDTAATTTDLQSALLDWNKDGVHLVGVNNGSPFFKASRVAFATAYVGATDLFKLSANGCLIANIDFVAGVASANPTGCMTVTGQHNRIKGCHITGFGNAANDIAGAYSLKLAGAENVFEDCIFGNDTITVGAAANSQLLTALGATRNTFARCRFTCYTNHATNHVLLRVPVSTVDRWLIFEDCQFINPIGAGSTQLTSAGILAVSGGSPQGNIFLIGPKTGVFGCTHWNSSNTGDVYAIGGGTAVAATYGGPVAVTL